MLGTVQSKKRTIRRCGRSAGMLAFRAYGACSAVKRVRLVSASTPASPQAADHPTSLPDAGSPLPGTMTDIAEPVAEDVVTWSPPPRQSPRAGSSSTW